MRGSFEDITERMAEPPKWWDENGTPRYDDHHPKLAPNIYANEVVLYLIACQACGCEFAVQESSDGMWSRAMVAIQVMMTKIGDALLEETVQSPNRERVESLSKEWAKHRYRNVPPTAHPIADEIRARSLHYGDPPNTGCCPVGPTMNCWDLRVLEYWARSTAKPDAVEVSSESLVEAISKYEWERFAELEIELPDASHASQADRRRGD